MAKVATRYIEVDPWVIEEKGFHPDRSCVSESIFALGNEFTGVRGYFEEGYSGQTMTGSYFNGIFERFTVEHPFGHRGIEMLVQICRYYASRGQYSQKTGEFGFWNVMGPDEFHMQVHNNAYTNVMAKKIFEYALEVITEMKTKAPKELASVAKKVGLKPSEQKSWKQMAVLTYNQ